MDSDLIPWRLLAGPGLCAGVLLLARLAGLPTSSGLRVLNGCALLVVSYFVAWGWSCLTPVVLAIGALLPLAGLLALRWQRVLKTDAPARKIRRKPQMLIYQGQFLPLALRAAGLSEDSLRRRLARQGITNLDWHTSLIREPSGRLCLVQSPLPCSSHLTARQMPLLHLN